jgi:hypothetical protein
MFKKRLPGVMQSASFIADCEEDGLAAKIIGHVAAALPAKRN